MKKTLLLTAIFLSTVLLCAQGPLQAQEGKALSMPGQEIVIEGKKPARFDHGSHAALGLDCGICHHTAGHQPLKAADIAALSNADQLRCLSCHNNTFPVKELQSPQDLFHTRCKDCHSKGLNGKKGPTQCDGCHVKAQKSPKKIEGC